MRILFSHYGLYRKSGWGRTFEFARSMAEFGHNVTITCTNRRFWPLYSTTIEEGVKIVKFGDFLPVSILSIGYGILSLIGRIIYSCFHKYDVCHTDSHRDCGYIPCIVNRRFYQSKLVIEWWDDFGEKAKNTSTYNLLKQIKYYRDPKLEISTKKNADGVIVLSKLLYDKSIRLGIPENKVTIIHGGCDVRHIQYMPFNIFKEKLGISRKVLTLGLIGMGDGEYEDVKHVLEAIEECNVEKVRFINFGRPFKKAYSLLPNMESLIIEGGWVDYYENPSILGAVDVYVLTKENNIMNKSGWPTKFGDYLACGRPILLNLYGEIISFNKSYHPGVIIVDNEKDCIKQTINDLLECKYNLEEMGLRNRVIAEKNSWLSKAKDLEQFYIKIVKMR